MNDTIGKLKKIRGRSWDELRTRGGQAFSAYSEKFGMGPSEPTDAEFVQLLATDASAAGDALWAELLDKFHDNGERRFFEVFAEPKVSAAYFRTTFGLDAVNQIVLAADKITAGRIDLLGYRDLEIGTSVDWHYEPVSGVRSPLKHWKQFDEMDSDESGDKKVIWELNRHQHFFTLGAAYFLTGDERYARTFADHIESWMDQNAPGQGVNWSSSLEIAFRSMSWIWGLNLFRGSDSLSTALFKRAAKFLYLHGSHIERYLSTYYSPNTHLTGEALGLYYIGSQLTFLKSSPQWVELGASILTSEVDRQIYPDGVYFEQSTWYQRYTVDIYTHFKLLSDRVFPVLEGAPAGSIEVRLQTALEFMASATRPDGTTPLIGDDDGGRMIPGKIDPPNDFRSTLAAGAALFARADLKYVAGGVSPEVFWLCGANGAAAYHDLVAQEPGESSQAFPDGGYYIMRDGWGENDNFLMIDCGEVGSLAGGHGHADTLAIEVALSGKPLLVDPGTYTYHKSREIRDSFRTGHAHNALTIDGQSSSEPGNKFSWRSRAAARCSTWINDERFCLFEGSHDGFERLERPATHTRSILFLKGDYIIIRDAIDTRGAHDHTFTFQFAAGVNAEVDAEGDFVNGDDWRIFAFGDGARWSQNDSSVSNAYGSKVRAAKMSFVSSGSGKQEFFTFLMPAAVGQNPEVMEIPMMRGRGFAIVGDSSTDLFVYGDGGETAVTTEFFESRFRFNWLRVPGGSTDPSEYIAADGGRFIVDDQDHAADRESYVRLVRNGSDLKKTAGSGQK